MAQQPAASEPTLAAEARASVRRWAAGFFGAPRDFDELITSIEQHDQVLTRLATEIQRREVFHERIPGPKGRRSAPRLSLEAIDPWAISLEELRRQSEYEDTCSSCGGTGEGACGSCSGSGRIACHECRGSGKVWKQYKKSGRYIQCRVCRASGTVKCGTCGGSGTVTCSRCAGSGNQLVWCAYRQSSRTLVELHADSAIIAAHPQLADSRTLNKADLSAFVEMITEDDRGLLNPASLEGGLSTFLTQHTPPIDPRLERVSQQQLLRFGVPRRDVSYELCGATGTLVLSGLNLAPATTAEALRPIRRRVWTWSTIAVVFGLAVSAGVSAFQGPGVYFARANSALAVLGLIAVAFGILGVGAITRALRPGFHFRPFRHYETAGLASLALTLAALFTVTLLSRPSAAEAHAAIVRGDVARARVVVDALAATREDSRKLADLRDEVELAAASALDGAAKLEKLDAIAGHSSAPAALAARDARALRISLIEKALASIKPVVAIQLLDGWPGGSPEGEPAVAELRARAHDEEYEVCDDDGCRWKAAASSAKAAPTPARQQRLAQLRPKLLEELDVAGQPRASRVLRLKRLGAADSLARSIGDADGDKELSDKTRFVAAFVGGERQKVALVGAERELLTELLGVAVVDHGKTAEATIGGVAVFFSMRGGRCAGVYLTGATRGERVLNDAEHSATTLQVLSQAVGRKVGMPEAPRQATVSKWGEGGIPVVARWRDGQLIELRIGDVNP